MYTDRHANIHKIVTRKIVNDEDTEQLTRHKV